MKKYQLLIYMSLALLFSNCKGQGNPKYIGKTYGVFDLDKIIFNENPDTLLSKVEKYYKLPNQDCYFNKDLNKYIATDTHYHIYRIVAKSVTDGMFKFKI